MWFTAKPKVTCFYCNSTLPLLADDSDPDGDGHPRQVERTFAFARGTRACFDCSACGCTNERGQDGHIVSSARNGLISSSERAFVTRERLAGASSTSHPPPFCRQCLSNQSLQIHLLSSYPSCSSDESDTEEEGKSSFPPLPEYKNALDRRYPLVCANCKSRVEGILRERDYRIKTSILGGRLRETGTDRVDRTGSTQFHLEARTWLVAGAIWRLRGLLWILSHASTVFVGTTNLFGSSKANGLPYLVNPLALPCLLSAPLWVFWDPTWNILRKERKKRGRAKYRVEHRELYIILQGIALLVRTIASLAVHFQCFSSADLLRFLDFGLILSALIASLAAFRIPLLSAPPPILLRSIDSPSRPSTPRNLMPPCVTNSFSQEDEFPDPLEPLQNLSLSNRTSILASSPVPSERTSSSSSVLRNGISAPLTAVRSRLGAGPPESAKFGLPSFDLAPRPRRCRTSALGPLWSPPATTITTEDDDDRAVPPRDAHGRMDMPVVLERDLGQARAAGDEVGRRRRHEPPSPLAMDWTPSTTSVTEQEEGEEQEERRLRGGGRPAHGGGSGGGGVSFRPRQFVVPDLRAPTGLEAILERFGLASDAQTTEKMEVDSGEEEGGGGREATDGHETGWWRRWVGG